jgi:hypothetical protein
MVNVQPGLRSTLAYFNNDLSWLGVAEMMAPDADESVLVFGDKEPKLQTELFLCFECYHSPVNLGELRERRNEAKAEAEADHPTDPDPATPETKEG